MKIKVRTEKLKTITGKEQLYVIIGNAEDDIANTIINVGQKTYDKVTTAINQTNGTIEENEVKETIKLVENADRKKQK